MTTLNQLFDQADGTAITAANSGPQGSDAFDSITSNANIAFTYSTTVKAAGTSGAKIAPTGAVQGSMAWTAKLAALNATTMTYRGYFYFTALPSVATNILFGYTSDATSVNFLNLTSTGTLTMSTDTSDGTHRGYSLSGVTLAVNTLYRFEGQVVLSPTAGSMLMQVFSGDSTSAIGTLNPTGITTCTTAGATMSRFAIGKNTTSPTFATPYYADSFSVRDTAALFGPYVPANPTITIGSSVSGTTANLNAAVTTYDNVAPTHAWTKVSGPTATFSSATTQNPSVTLTSAGTYVFKDVITDDLGHTANASTTVTYTGATSAPSTSGALTTPRWVEVVTATAAAGGALSYGISPSTNTTQIAPGIFSGLIPSIATEYTVTVTEAGNANTTTFRFTVPGAATASGGGLRILLANGDSTAGGSFSDGSGAGPPVQVSHITTALMRTAISGANTVSSTVNNSGGSTTSLTRSGASLQVNGVSKRLSGANAYWVGLDDNNGVGFPAQSMITAAFTGMTEMGVNLVRAHTVGISTGTSQSYETAAGVYSDANLDRADWAVYQAKLKGIFLMVPLTDNWNYYHGGKWNFVHWAYQANSTGFAADTPGTTKDDPNERVFFANTAPGLRVRALFKDYISHWLNHVNPYTGLAYKDDPTIAVIETGNEIYYASQLGTNEWTQDIASYIKGIAPNKLVADGSAADRVAVSSAPGLTAAAVDIVGAHYYPQQQSGSYPPIAFGASGAGYPAGTALQQLAADATAAANAGMPFIVGEYPWTRSDVASWYSAIEGNTAIDGDMFWSMIGGTEVHGGSFGGDDYPVHRPYLSGNEATSAPALSRHIAAISKISPTNGAGG